MGDWTPSPDSTAVFVGSYAGASEPGIHVVLIDAGRSGRVVASFAGIEHPSYLLAHPDGSHLYAVSETGLASDGREGSVEALRLVAGPEGSPVGVYLGGRTTEGDHPCHLAIDPTGRWLVASNYGGGSFTVFPIATSGEILERSDGFAHSGAGSDSRRQEAPHIHSSAFTPDGRMLLVADLGIDRVVGYAFDSSAGTVQRALEVDMGPGAGPRHVAFHPDGAHLFVVNELGNTVTTLAYDPVGPGVELVGVTDIFPDDERNSLAAAIRVGNDGARVFVSNRGDDSITAFRFSPGEGLARVGDGPSGGSWPRDMALLEHLGCLVVANRREGELAIVALEADGVTIGSVVDRLKVSEPACVVIA